MYNREIDFTEKLATELHVLDFMFGMSGHDTVYTGPGVYKANCHHILEKVTDGNVITISYDSDNDNCFWYHADSMITVEHFGTEKTTHDSESAHYYFKLV